MKTDKYVILPLTALLLGIICGPAMAEDATGTATNEIPVDTIVIQAMKHSRMLGVARLEEVVAEARARQMRAAGRPQVNLQASATRYEGLPEPESTGSGLAFPVIPDRYQADINVSYPLFTGGRLSSQSESTERIQESTSHRRRSAESDMAKEANVAYWNWSLAFHARDVRRADVVRMEQHAGDVRSRQKAGVATDSELLAVEVNLDKARLDLEESNRAETVARAVIAYLTGKDVQAGIAPKKAGAPAATPDLAISNMISIALMERPDHASREREVLAAVSETRANRARYYPSATLVAGYQYANPNMILLPPEEEWEDDYYFGVRLQWNLLDFDLTRAALDEAEAKRRQAEERYADSGEKILLELNEVKAGMESAVNRNRLAERALDSARSSLATVTDAWKNGVARHAEVLDAHLKLADAEYRLLSARTDCELAGVALRHALGRLRAE